MSTCVFASGSPSGAGMERFLIIQLDSKILKNLMKELKDKIEKENIKLTDEEKQYYNRYKIKVLSSKYKNTYLYMTGQTTITKKDYIELCKRFLNENKFDNISKDNITVTDFGEIITFKFCVENGTYIFATNDYANNIVTLTPNNNSPLVNSLNYSSLEAYKKSIREYPIELNNQSLNLFCIYGSDSFINMNIKNLVNYIGTNTGGAVGETQEKNNSHLNIDN